MDLSHIIPPNTHKQPPLHFFSDKETLVDDDKFIIEKVFKHQKFANKGKDKHRRPHILKWYVKYKGYDKPEWYDASEFLHDINQDWLQYNIKHKIDVGIQDVCVLRSKYVVHPRFFSTGSFASVTGCRFLIILTLCNCVACIIGCDCFPFPSLCRGIQISISMNSMMNFGLAYTFQVSVFCRLGSWVQDPPPPALQDSVFYSYFFSDCIGRLALSLREWDRQFEAIFSSLISSACMYFVIALPRPNPDNIQSVIDRAKSCRSRCTKSRCTFIAW